MRTVPPVKKIVEEAATLKETVEEATTLRDILQKKNQTDEQ